MGFTVKQARQYAGFTQREMAEKLGISRDTYRKIEQSLSISARVSKKFFSQNEHILCASSSKEGEKHENRNHW